MPKVDSTSAVPTTAQLSPAKQKLLAQWQRGQANRLAAQDGQQNGQANGKATGDTLARRTQQSTLPLSYAQQRLWFLDQMGAGANYNMPMALHLVGPLDVDSLQRALQEIVRRHESLRTIFRQQGATVEQIILDDAPFVLPIVDLSAANDPMATAQQRAQAEAVLAFDLSCDLPLRGQLLQLGAEEHLLLLTQHHIASDGWSLGIFRRELHTLYTTFCQGLPTPLAPLVLQYADFAVWQQQQWQQDHWAPSLHYWKKQLANAPATLDLPIATRHQAASGYQGQIYPFELPTELAAHLHALSHQSGATLFMTLLAAFALLLYRYSRQSDLVIGTTIANRQHKELETLIGFFTNTLPLRLQVEESAAAACSFAALLQHVRQVALDAYSHQDIPFDLLVKELKPVRQATRNPFFQIMFDLHHNSEQAVGLPGLTVTLLQGQRTTSIFDLTLSMVEEGERLHGFWEYRQGLFEEEAIARMAGHYQCLLASIVADPQQPIGALSLLTAAEQQQLLLDWSGVQSSKEDGAAYPRQQGISQLFEAQVERTPDAIALINPPPVEGTEAGSTTPHQADSVQTYGVLTYAELNAMANRIAHFLRGQGVGGTLGAETKVAVCLERTLAAIAVVWGVWKAGGVFVPLDPSHPPERLAFILADAAVPIVITQNNLAPLFGNWSGLCLQIESEWAAKVQEQVPTNLPPLLYPQQAAYIIYTSGSTGQPKGVVIEHGGLVAHCWQIRHHYELTPADGVLQFASLSFDAALEQLLPPLICGARVLLGQAWLPVDFIRQLVAQGITVVDLPPAYWQQLLQLWVESPALLAQHHLRLLIAGADVLRHELVALWQQSPLRQVRLINAYGPTEATIAAACFDVPPMLPVPHSTIPIGRPVGNKWLYILDTAHNPTPIGIPGELCIGGAGIAREYLHQPVLTAAKFIDNPFPAAGGRLYKTGDLARYGSDGNIEFLGRLDSQVKIRGFRIELGEIEAVLQQHDQVQTAIVTVYEARPGDKQLAAYIVQTLPITEAITESQEAMPHNGLDSGKQQDLVQALRQLTRQKLPEYMIPTSILVIDALPLSANGKVDVQQLPKPNAVQSLSHFSEPSTPTETTVAAIWRELLQVPKVGREDNFFALGGHSLLVAQLIYTIERQLGVELPVRALFEFPTLLALCQQIDRLRQSDSQTIAYTTAFDWHRETVLDERLQPPTCDTQTASAANNAIFCTGVTGFLGVYLLAELLAQTSAPIYCLVRAANAAAALARIRTSLEQYELGAYFSAARIVPVLGDLSQPLLDLTAAQFQALAEQIDVIYHNGAWVNNLYPYAVLKAVNVTGTQEVLRLAGQGHAKAIHYISTMSVFPYWMENCYEDQPLYFTTYRANDLDPQIGYNVSKIVAEQLMLHARARGFPIAIYRPTRAIAS